MRSKSLGLVMALGVVVAACGGAGDDVGVGDDEAVLQITSEGGFAPVEFALANGPRYTLLGDGRLVYQGYVTLEYPGRLVPLYQVATLDSNQMRAVLAMVDDIGLPDIEDETDDDAMNMVADATTEVVTFWDENGVHRLAVYALGIEESPSERNQAFLELIQTFDQFTAEAPAEPYVAEQLRVVAGPGTVDPQFEDTRPWPLPDTDFSDWETLPNGWHCRVIDGPTPDDFESATQATTWEHPDGVSEPLLLLVRPLVPGEPDCPA
ncbi:MAG TPA: hypothetical protein VFT85_00165 [Acidimicrobiia bacterium]|nr:hypothetical protein [Acidimicrobiia bacterium]